MSPTQNRITWKIGGEAGFGIMSTGAIFAKTCMRAGLSVVEYAEYPSLIRGGHNTDQVSVSDQPLHTHRTTVDVLVALNRETLDRHLAEVSPHGVILYDQSDRTFKDFQPTTIVRQDLTLIGLPLEHLSLQAGATKLMRNSVALGATFALLDCPFELPATVVRDSFIAKGEAIAVMNVNVLKIGYTAVTPAQTQACPWRLVPRAQPEERLLLTGNDALALGALQAGCLFYAAYPMTPASSVLHFLAEYGPPRGMVVRHAEDEIAAINEAIGAAYAGVRAMCGTAGGGFALMTEAVSMAGMTEVGLVIIEAQRGGPSTGLPTWTEQGDVRQVMHAGQGDVLRVVLAPGTPSQCFTMIQEAFDLAERYQTPVIIMTDKVLAEGHWSIPTLAGRKKAIDRGALASAADVHQDQNFRRYRTDVVDGISPRTRPGTPGGIFLANSDEHDEFGYSNEDIAVRQAQMDKRAAKETTLRKKLPAPLVHGPTQADVTLVTWGSSVNPCRQAADDLGAQGVNVNVVQLTHLQPFPVESVQKLLAAARLAIMVEGNQSGQVEGIIREQTGFTFAHHYRRYDGRPIDPIDLTKLVQGLVT